VSGLLGDHNLKPDLSIGKKLVYPRKLIILFRVMNFKKLKPYQTRVLLLEGFLTLDDFNLDGSSFEDFSNIFLNSEN
jgi:hypothetical protein